MATTMIVRWPAERRFHLAMALGMFAAVFVGFSRSFFLRPLFPEQPAPSESIFYVHGVVFTAWLVLLVLQPTLVAIGRTDLHRTLGWFGAALAVAMLVLGCGGALVAARRATGFIGVPVPPLEFLAVPLFDMLMFATLFGAAIARRRDSQSHKRLMLLASINLITAGIARWPFAFMAGGPMVAFGLTDAFILAMLAWDLASRRRVHPVTLWGGLATVVSQPLRLALSSTGPWLAFATWAVSLLD